MLNSIAQEERAIFNPVVPPPPVLDVVPVAGVSAQDQGNLPPPQQLTTLNNSILSEVILSEDTFYRVLTELAPVSLLEVGSGISEKKQKNARKFFGVPPEEPIYAMLDVTVFASGKKGFAIGAKGIYCRNPSWCTSLPGKLLQHNTTQHSHSHYNTTHARKLKTKP